jgi:hypothetical protein
MSKHGPSISYFEYLPCPSSHQTQETIQELLSATFKHNATHEGATRSRAKPPRSASTANVESNDDVSRPQENQEQHVSPAPRYAPEKEAGLEKELAAIRATLDKMQEERVCFI